MDISKFVSNFIDDIDKINNDNIKIYKYNLKEPLIKKEFKEIKSYKEMKNFTDSRKKFYENQSYLDEQDKINIFENDIIKTYEQPKNFYDLDKETKLKHIEDYMKRKKIKLSCDINVIDHILNDNTLLKKYISIDKTYNMINKISFFKKKETGDYDIVLTSNKVVKKNFFIKK